MEVKYPALLPMSGLLLTSVPGNGFSSLGRFSAENMGKLEVNPDDFRAPLLMEAASSATRDERMEVSICAEDVEAVSLAATAAAAAFLFSSSLVFTLANELTGCNSWLLAVE